MTDNNLELSLKGLKLFACLTAGVVEAERPGHLGWVFAGDTTGQHGAAAELRASACRGRALVNKSNTPNHVHERRHRHGSRRPARRRRYVRRNPAKQQRVRDPLSISRDSSEPISEPGRQSEAARPIEADPLSTSRPAPMTRCPTRSRWPSTHALNRQVDPEAAACDE
jgi:hypothetical protein